MNHPLILAFAILLPPLAQAQFDGGQGRGEHSNGYSQPACNGTPAPGSLPNTIQVCTGGQVVLKPTGLTTGIGIIYKWYQLGAGNIWMPVGNGPVYTTPPVTQITHYRIGTQCGGSLNWSDPVQVSPSTGFLDQPQQFLDTVTDDCWSVSGATPPTWREASAFGLGTGSACFPFWLMSAGQEATLTSRIFLAAPFAQFLRFDVAGANYPGYTDHVFLETSADGGGTWTVLVDLDNGPGGQLNTAGLLFSTFTPTPYQWRTLFVVVPAGADRFRFRGVSQESNSVHLDNVYFVPCFPDNAQPYIVPPSAPCHGESVVLTSPDVGEQCTHYWWQQSANGTTDWANVTEGSGHNTANYTTGPITSARWYRMVKRNGTGFPLNTAPILVQPVQPSFPQPFHASATPDCWTVGGTPLPEWATYDADGSTGSGSVRFPLANTVGPVEAMLTSPSFAPLATAVDLRFDVAGAYGDPANQLVVESSPDMGSTWYTVTTLTNDSTGALNTAGPQPYPYLPDSGQWSAMQVPLSVGTTRIRFRAIGEGGDHFYLDHVALVHCLAGPSAGVITGADSVCDGSSSSVSLAVQGATAGYGTNYQWQWSVDGFNTWTAVPGSGNTPTLTCSTAGLIGTLGFRMIVSCTFGGASDTSAVHVLNVLPLPSVWATVSVATYCAGGPPVALQAFGQGAFSWPPPIGLDTTAGPIVHAQPSGPGNYTVTAVLHGCSSTASVAVGYGTYPVIDSIYADPGITCAGGTVELHVEPQPVQLNYCIPYFIAEPFAYITNVSIGTINNTTNEASYSDYSSMSATVSAGASLPVSVTRASNYPDIVFLFVDWNRNGTLSDPGEATALYPTPGSFTYNGSLQIPANAVNGPTRMRVQFGFGSVAPACGWGEHSEVEDYTLNVTGGLPVWSYQWSPDTLVLDPQNASTLALGFAQAQAFSVTVSNALGCSVDTSVIVPVDPTDTDMDGVGDCADQCPTDPAKIWAGSCGCGNPEPGMPCDDGDPATIDDAVGMDCICAGVPAVSLALRVALEGPYNTSTGLMNDALRSLPGFPLTEPYTAMGYAHVGGGGESMDPSALDIIGPQAIVDWLVVELRSAADPTVVLATRSALVQRDGDVVGTDDVSPVTFNLAAGSYHVAVRHRNHLGCMTAAPVGLAGVPAVVDLTSVPTYGPDARKSLSGAFPVNALWAGDVTGDGALKYTGASNDRDPVLLTVGGSLPTNTVAGYLRGDVNLDGVVKYTGSGNDRDRILVNIGGTVPTAVRVEQMP